MLRTFRTEYRKYTKTRYWRKGSEAGATPRSEFLQGSRTKGRAVRRGEKNRPAAGARIFLGCDFFFLVHEMGVKIGGRVKKNKKITVDIASGEIFEIPDFRKSMQKSGKFLKNDSKFWLIFFDRRPKLVRRGNPKTGDIKLI